MVDLHPIKHETFDIDSYINIDPKGFHRTVDQFHVTDCGLYMARGANHPKFGYLESWLLPDLNLRANIFHFRPEYESAQHFYFDIANISHKGQVWETRDLYIDLVTYEDQPFQVLDIDELAAATAQGMISAAEAERAIDATLQAVEGITRASDDPMAWLRSCGYHLSWAPQVTLMPAE